MCSGRWAGWEEGRQQHIQTDTSSPPATKPALSRRGRGGGVDGGLEENRKREYNRGEEERRGEGTRRRDTADGTGFKNDGGCERERAEQEEERRGGEEERRRGSRMV